jgi:hypothetical protein
LATAKLSSEKRTCPVGHLESRGRLGLEVAGACPGAPLHVLEVKNFVRRLACFELRASSLELPATPENVRESSARFGDGLRSLANLSTAQQSDQVF